jgi:NAD(P)-dependent dehydrogenase (short-subunit alcohol dehydrogenase family)
MSNRFEGKSAIVTGAASGIGQAVAQRLAREGAHVACVDLNQEAAAATAAGIGAAGGRAFAVACDVSDSAAVKAMVDGAVATLGGLDVLCNVAGIGKFEHSHEWKPEHFDRILGVNLHGTYYCCSAALPHLLASKGNIVNTASTAGMMGQPWSAAYCASKGGVVLLTKALATEYMDKGVRVNAVAPGGTETAIMASFMPPEGELNYDLMRKMMSPMGFTKPDKMAGVFAFIASDEANYMTGSVVAMDGGITA